MRTGNAGSKVIRLLSSSPMTYAELEKELDPSVDLKGIVDVFRKGGRIKKISAGGRQVLFTRESQRRDADIMALGKYALPLYRMVEEEGPLRTHNMTANLGGIRADNLRRSLDNLVTSGYMKRRGTLSSAAGNLYHIDGLTKSQENLSVIGIREEQAYNVIKEAKRPVTSAEIAEKMGVSIFNAAEISSRLVERGLAYKSSLRSGAKNEKIRTSMYYADRGQENLAAVLSASPVYGEVVYGALSNIPAPTTDVAEKTGLERGCVYQVLKVLRNHGLIKFEKGSCRNPSKWYLNPR